MKKNLVAPSGLTSGDVIVRRAPGAIAAFAALLTLALLLRAAVTFAHRNIIWPDEVYQTVEPAYHLVFGDWVRSWEWVVGMRSWLIPALLAIPLWLAQLVDPSRQLGGLLITWLMIALSLTPVAIGFLWGSRIRGIWGGLFVGGLAAIWPDLIYMAPHPLTDVFASHLLLVALYAAFPLSTIPSVRRLAVAGALMGLTLYMRMQLGPAVALAVLMVAGRSSSRWRAVLTGGGVGLAILGAFDWATLGTPFQSIWLNFWFNIVGHVSDEFGVQGRLFYVRQFYVIWGPAVLVALLIILLNFRKHLELLLVLLTIIATQSLVGHKEWRFIFPAIPIFVLLVGLGLLGALPRIAEIARRWGAPRWLGAVGIAVFAGGLALTINATPTSASFWRQRSAMLKAFDELRTDRDVCGIGILYFRDPGAEMSWGFSPGSNALAPGVPLYAAQPDDGWKSSASYNAAVIEEGDTPPSPFRLVSCGAPGSGNASVPGARTCLWRRPGGCDRAAGRPLLVNWPRYFWGADGQLRNDRLSPSLLGLRSRPSAPLTSAMPSGK